MQLSSVLMTFAYTFKYAGLSGPLAKGRSIIACVCKCSTEDEIS